LLSCGVDRASSEKTLQLGRSSGGTVRAFVGVHPSEALASESQDWLPAAVELATGVGEIGLDPEYSPVGKGSAQRRIFETQLGVASRAGKPVQVHSRGAVEECLESLGASGLGSVLMHWLESEESLATVMGRGYFVSFGPALLYSRKLQRLASAADPDLVLLESDGPVTFETLGGAGGPMLVPSVAFKLSELWKEPFDGALLRLLRNSLRYLGEPEKG
jgi:TatD DNase family protein